jgi:hypothetical protein
MEFGWLAFLNLIPQRTYPWGKGEGYEKDVTEKGYYTPRVFFWREFHHCLGGVSCTGVVASILAFCGVITFWVYLLLTLFTFIIFCKEFYLDSRGKWESWDFKNTIDWFFWTFGFVLGWGLVYFLNLKWIGFAVFGAYVLFDSAMYFLLKKKEA